MDEMAPCVTKECNACLKPLPVHGVLDPGCEHHLHISCYMKLVTPTPKAPCPTCEAPMLWQNIKPVSGRPFLAPTARLEDVILGPNDQVSPSDP